MSTVDLVICAPAALVIGLLIGSIGVGGVLLVPWLTQVMGLLARDAVAITMFAFVATGIAALAVSLRSLRHAGGLDWRLVLATMPGSLAGAWALSIIPERAALLVLAATVIIVGVRVLVGRTPHGESITTVGRVSSVPIGIMTGFASALTGTGGPMVLTPVLVWRGVPLLTAILLGQVVQLPIAATATIGNVLTGGADLVAGAVLGLMMVPGALIGRRLAEALPQRVLGYIVGVMLLASGLGFVLKALSPSLY